jgi:hypothetical protein
LIQHPFGVDAPGTTGLLHGSVHRIFYIRDSSLPLLSEEDRQRGRTTTTCRLAVLSISSSVIL